MYNEMARDVLSLVFIIESDICLYAILDCMLLF